MNANPSSAAIWFPIVEGLQIPVPKTSIIPVDSDDILDTLNGKKNFNVELLQRIKNCISEYPVFIRTDLLSGKHNWKHTCYVPNENELESHILAVCASNENKSCGNRPIFFHGVMNYSAIVVREFLQLETSFLAFSGDMPINKERRYFISGGNILCHHPYWPEDIFLRNSSRGVNDPDWRSKISELSRQDADEVKLLSEYAHKVSQVLPEYWSVDFAKGKNGVWYLIDMARGEKSYHMPHS